jgi:hypothetical protein
VKAGTSSVFMLLTQPDAGFRRHDRPEWNVLLNCDTVAFAGMTKITIF